MLKNRLLQPPRFSVRTSAAFLSSLSANLRIQDDDLTPSPMSTPPTLMHGNSVTLPSPYSSPMAIDSTEGLVHRPDGHNATAQVHMPAIDRFEDVPDLTTAIAATDSDRYEGLKLVADSVAEQRQVAGIALMTNPVNIFAFLAVQVALVAAMYRVPSDVPVILTTFAGITMAALVLVRYLTNSYLNYAEDIRWAWLGEDTLIVTRFGDQVIGCLVLAWKVGEGKRRKKSGCGVIRAWTVKLKYRGKGVGSGLLEEAVRLTREKGGDGLEFANEHANHKRVLKPIYNDVFDKQEREARGKLEQVIRAMGTLGRKR